MKIGIHNYVWGKCFDRDSLPLIDNAKEMGYDSFEVVVGEEQFDAIALSKRLICCGMDATMSGVIGAGNSASSADAEVRQKSREYFRRCFDIAQTIGAKNFVGPLYINGQKAGPRPETEKHQEWLRTVETLRLIAEDAQSAGVALCVEPLNRYKTDLANTVSDVMRMIDDIGLDNVKVLFDTYHANIEEKSMTGAIESMGLKYLGEVHICDNDKGAPGSGHIDFKSVAEALKRIGYDGYVVFESFVPFGNDNIWRKLAPTQDDLARDAIRYARKLF